MRRSLFWTLLGINLLVVGVAVGLAALMIGRLADAIFASLMKEFHIQADVPHHLFVTALWRSPFLASPSAGGVGVPLPGVPFWPVVPPGPRVVAVGRPAPRGGFRVPAARAP